MALSQKKEVECLSFIDASNEPVLLMHSGTLSRKRFGMAGDIEASVFRDVQAGLSFQSYGIHFAEKLDIRVHSLQNTS